MVLGPCWTLVLRYLEAFSWRTRDKLRTSSLDRSYCTALRSLPLGCCGWWLSAFMSEFHPVPVQAFTWGRSWGRTSPWDDLHGRLWQLASGNLLWPLASGLWEKSKRAPWHLDVRLVSADEGFLPSYVGSTLYRTVGGSVSSVIVLTLH